MGECAVVGIYGESGGGSDGEGMQRPSGQRVGAGKFDTLPIELIV